MPFTFSHPAAAIPLRRYGLVTSALVVGSMAPDFEYFTRFAQQDRSAHAYPGVLLISLPFAFAALAVFHHVLKWPTLSLMPHHWQVRLVDPARPFRWGPPRRFLLILASLAIGILTHLAWDAFTHEDGWLVQLWPAMRVPLFHVGRTAIPTYKLAQHGSTLLGGLIIFVVVIMCMRRTHPSSRALPPALSRSAKTAVVVIGGVLAISAGLVRGTHLSAGAEGLPSLQSFAAGLAVTTISVAAVELLLFSISWWVWVEPHGSAVWSKLRRSHGTD